MTITGIDAPSALTIGNVGSWTVHVSIPGGSSTNLHYSVVWGDEVPTMMNSGIMMPQQNNVQSSATFTHAYQRSGTYQATFTVTDDAGHSANVVSTVNVGPLY